jgi:LmbE family N-acetylglucosaminyl deacetylase
MLSPNINDVTLNRKNNAICLRRYRATVDKLHLLIYKVKRRSGQPLVIRKIEDEAYSRVLKIKPVCLSLRSDSERVMVFAPHPDDETLACGGTIAKSVRQGKGVYIVIMTDGRNSHKILLSIEKDPTPRELIAIRRKEAQFAAQILGVHRDNLIFLNFEDGSLASHHREGKALVLNYLLKIMPTEIFMPDKSDSNPDHYSTSSIVLDAIRESKLSPSIYSYIVWTTNGSHMSKMSGEIEFDISEFFKIKRSAIEAYKSQVTKLFKSQTRPVLRKSMLVRFLLPVERFKIISDQQSRW